MTEREIGEREVGERDAEERIQAPPVLHMIGNAHIDPVWLWQWPEGYQEVRATFQSAIERMEEYPEFIFTADSVCYLAWVEESDPELFQAIAKRIAEGRWQPVGGWWVEPDCNIPSGESFVRQALYSQRYLWARFKVLATVGCNVDPFGHNASLPQLLRKAGMDSYVFQRPGPHEMALPGPYFWWRSPDGSQVLAYRIPYQYSSPGSGLAMHVDAAVSQVPAGEPELMVFYGVGNHGGGPTRANLDSIRRLDAVADGRRLLCSSPRQYFDSLMASGRKIPVHCGELQHHAVGCYSAHSGIKAWNRRAENQLQRAEKWATVAGLVAGVANSSRELAGAWKLVLFNQFHDTLAGTAIRSAYEDSRDQYGYASSVAAAVLNRAVQSVSRLVDLPAQDLTAPVLVFNPHPWPVASDVELEFGGFPGRVQGDGKADGEPGTAGGVTLVDACGEPVPVQRTRSEATVNGPRHRLVFGAEVPPLGYRAYRLRPAGRRAAMDAADGLATCLENDVLSLRIDPGTGWLQRLVHKASGSDLIGGRCGGHAVVVRDDSDTWAHDVTAFDDVAGHFRCTSVRLVETGPVRTVLRVESRYGSSTLAEELILGARSPFVEVRAVLDWHERHRALKLRIPTGLQAVHATFEVPYGHIERLPEGWEEPGQSWVDVTGELPGGGQAGLSVITGSKHGYDVSAGCIGITVARSPVCAWHAPKRLDDDGIYDYLDQGEQRFTYRLVPHGGDWRRAGTVRLAAELNQPCVAHLEHCHPGGLPPQASFASASPDAVVLTVVKVAEDASGDLVVRAYESHGRPVRARLDLPVADRVVETEFGPGEVKTLRIPRDRRAPVREMSLLEWPFGADGRVDPDPAP